MLERNARVVRPDWEGVGWSKVREGNTGWKAKREVHGVVAGVIRERQVGRNEGNGKGVREADRGENKRTIESVIYEWTIVN